MTKTDRDLRTYDNLAEIWTAEGPTGDFAWVLTGEVQDAGGNVLFSGAAEYCRAAAEQYRIPVKLVPKQWRIVGEHAISDLPLWQMVVNA